MVIIAVLKDAFSDITGGVGIVGMSVPMLSDVNDLMKLICSLGGAVLLYFSIRYKILLYKDLKRKQDDEEKDKKHFKK